MMVEANLTGTSDGPANVWVVIPAYNEASRIGKTLFDLMAALERAPDRVSCHVVVVDDGSSDATWNECQKFPVWSLKHPINCGQGAALRTGIEFALSRGADAVVTYDADGQHCAEEMDRLLDPILDGQCEVVLGSRFLGQTHNMPLSRRVLLKVAVFFTKVTTGLSLSDSHNGFRGMSRLAAETIDIKQPRMAHASEILDQIARKRLSYREAPVTVRYTTESLEKGQSTMDAARVGCELILGRFVR